VTDRHSDSVQIASVHPHTTDEELAAIILAVPSLWPTHQTRRRIVDDRTWRFSGRKHNR